MKDSTIQLLYKSAAQIGIALSSGQLDAFNLFGDLLIERNRSVNLTAIDSESDIAIKHFWDSLSPAAYVSELAAILAEANTPAAAQRAAPTTSLAASATPAAAQRATPAAAPEVSSAFAPAVKPEPSPSPIKLLDIGAGAGFPGIPLKILFGALLDVTLIDSTLKKVNFMNEAIGALGLSGCKAVHARAEEIARLSDWRGRFSIVTARALAALPLLCKYCLPFLASGGILIAMKGRRAAAEEELEQSKPTLERLGGTLLNTICFNHFYERTIIVAKKA